MRPRPSGAYSGPTGKLVIYVAVDAGWRRDYAAIVAVTIEGDQVRYVYEKVFKPTPDDPLDFENTIEKTLRYLHEHCTIQLCLVDPTQMEYLKERMQKIGIPIEALTQNHENQTATTQTLFDLFRTERFSISARFNNTSELRETITRTVFEERSGGLRFAKNQSIKTDLSVATAMACLAATRGQTGDITAAQYLHRARVYEDNFEDEDVGREPEPELEPLRADADWWKGVRKAPKMTDADANLRSLYGGIDAAFQWGGGAVSSTPFWRRR